MKRNDSVSVAKDRLRELLVSDRVNCTPDTFEKIHAELFQTISKYMEIRKKSFGVIRLRYYFNSVNYMGYFNN